MIEKQLKAVKGKLFSDKEIKTRFEVRKVNDKKKNFYEALVQGQTTNPNASDPMAYDALKVDLRYGA